jgi:hypothetical protein
MSDDDPDIKDVGDAFAACLRKAGELKPDDDVGVAALMAEAAAAGLTDVQSDMLAKSIAKATKVGLKTLRLAWAKALADLINARKAAEAPERERREAEAKIEAARKLEEERARLWASCSSLAESPTLLAEIEDVVHRLGLVNEGRGARAVYLTFTSRLLADEAICLLRSGASASGKNYVVERTRRLIPEHAIVQVSGSSPKALAYYGGEDPDALKHKVVYVPEAVILLERKQGEVDGGGFTSMFRTLISEGRIVYQVTTVRDGGPPITTTISKNGPIAAVLTCARDIDPEMKTRVLTMDTDESGRQTEAIVKRILSPPRPAPDLTPWLDLQLWLEQDGAPYQVEIPFLEAIYQAFKKWRPDFFDAVLMRMRRDATSFITGIKSSAVLHKKQRNKTASGAIIATLDDYTHCFEAFDVGLSSAHGEASEKIVAVVEAIEAMKGDLPSIRVTLRDLAKRLRVGSISTAKSRLDAALEYGAIDQNDTLTGRGGARYFTVIESSEAIRKKPGLGVFPPPNLVRNLFSPPLWPKSAEHFEQESEKT